MAPLFSSRAGVYAFGRAIQIRFPWPLCKIVLDTESLTIDVLFKQFQIPFSQIERLQMSWLGVRVIHHAPSVPRLINISGWGLRGRLRKAIVEHHLPVEL